MLRKFSSYFRALCKRLRRQEGLYWLNTARGPGPPSPQFPRCNLTIARALQFFPLLQVRYFAILPEQEAAITQAWSHGGLGNLWVTRTTAARSLFSWKLCYFFISENKRKVCLHSHCLTVEMTQPFFIAPALYNHTPGTYNIRPSAIL